MRTSAAPTPPTPIGSFLLLPQLVKKCEWEESVALVPNCGRRGRKKERSLCEKVKEKADCENKPCECIWDGIAKPEPKCIGKDEETQADRNKNQDEKCEKISEKQECEEKKDAKDELICMYNSTWEEPCRGKDKKAREDAIAAECNAIKEEATCRGKKKLCVWETPGLEDLDMPAKNEDVDPRSAERKTKLEQKILAGVLTKSAFMQEGDSLSLQLQERLGFRKDRRVWRDHGRLGRGHQRILNAPNATEEGGPCLSKAQHRDRKYKKPCKEYLKQKTCNGFGTGRCRWDGNSKKCLTKEKVVDIKNATSAFCKSLDSLERCDGEDAQQTAEANAKAKAQCLWKAKTTRCISLEDDKREQDERDMVYHNKVCRRECGKAQLVWEAATTRGVSTALM